MAISPPTPQWCWPSRREPIRASSPRCWSKSSAGDPDIASAEIAGPGFINLRLADAFWPRFSGSRAGRWRRFRPRRSEIRQARQCRICLGQSDRPDACRPLPQRRCRRRARQSARLRRQCGHARIRHQRRRCADRRARPLRVPALSRGAGRDDRRYPIGPLSRRLPEAGRLRRLPPNSATGLLAMAEGEAHGSVDASVRSTR